MATLQQLFDTICTDNLIPLGHGKNPSQRRNDIKTALGYLAASYGSTPDRLPLSDSLEATYRQQLTTYFEAHPKGPATIRNTIQAIGQFLKAVHQRTQTPLVPVVQPKTPKWRAAAKAMRAISPYKHQAWLNQSVYRLKAADWPDDITAGWEIYRGQVKGRLRQESLRKNERHLESYLGFLRLSPEERLATIPELARTKLQRHHRQRRRYEDDLQDIMTCPTGLAWDALFQTTHVQAYITWHAWRVHPDADATIPERPPSKPSTHGTMVAQAVARLAKATGRPETTNLYALWRGLPKPKKVHDKSAPYHQFEMAELEAVALELMAEARRMRTNAWASKHTGAHAAIRFQTGLILALGWRNPMRARNWCEALLDVNLRHDGPRWYWRFEGDELKVGQKGGKLNVFEPEISADAVAYLEEYLRDWRPRLPHSADDRHVFTTRFGTPLISSGLVARLQVNVYRFTGKRLFTHLLRTLFTSYHLTEGVDINSVAYALNDHPLTVLNAYNELQADKHRTIIHEANQRALAHGNGHALIPPVIPPLPKRPKAPNTDPDHTLLS